MPTIIDSLIVTLGLDSKDVDSKAPGVRSKLADLEKAASKTESGVKDIGKASKGTASELTVLSQKMGSFLALVGGSIAIRSFVKDTIETNTQLYFLSRNLEMNTQKLFAWGAAAQEIGGSKGTIQNFMRTIASMPGELLTGKMPQLLPLFARLGINFREPFSQIMVDLSKRFAGMDRKVAFSFGTASGIPEDVMNLILQGPQAVESAMGRTGKFGPTAGEAKSAAELKRGFTDLELQLVKIGYDLLYKVTPYLEKFLSVLQEIGGWAQRHERLVAIIAGLAAALAGVASLGTALSALTFAWTALVGAIEAALPVLSVVAIVAALGGAILLLWNDYKVWSEGGKSYFDWSGWTGLIEEAKGAWNDLADSIKGAWGWLGKWYDRAAKAMGIDTSSGAQSKAEDAAIAAYNKAHPGHEFVGNQSIEEKAQMIYRAEGFYAPRSGYVPDASGKGSHLSSSAKANIPQRANNPGDIEYGQFARAHGATGFVLARDPKTGKYAKIATFPDFATGDRAAKVLLQSKDYANLSGKQLLQAWQQGPSSLLNGVANASHVPASVSSATNSTSTHTDNSRVTNIGAINLQNPTGSGAVTPSMARGMDWTTLLTQQNSGLMP